MKLIARVLAPLAMAVLLTPALSLQAQNTVNPAIRSIEYPKVELFLGYSHLGTVSNDTVPGNRMVGLNGGSASVAFNLNRYIGLVADVGGYDDSQLQLTGTGANEPLVVSSSGTAYTFLFGPRFSFRNSTRFTPFAQVLVGGVHASDVTVSGCAGTSCTPLPAQTALAMTVGGGLDIRLTRHFSIRAVQAEYLMTRFADVAIGSTGAATPQNDLRLSSGLLFTFGGAQPLPVQLACAVQPSSGYPGDPLAVTATATNLNPKRHVTYSWNTNGGTVSGSDAAATIATKGIAPGTYAVTGHVTQGSHPAEQASCTASFNILPFAPPTITCSASPSTVNPGDPANITALGVSPQDRPLTYSYATTAGTVTGNTATATLNTTGAAPGAITITCSVVDDLGKSVSADTTVTVSAPPQVAAPLTRDLCAVSFDRDRKRPDRVDNEAKACLDDIALDMQRESTSRLVIVGNYAADEKPASAAHRSVNVRQYLVNEKGIDSSRIDARVGTDNGRTVTNVFVPAGASYNDNNTKPVDTIIDEHGAH
ncbi:MAG TPA: hypothetical protein VK814_06840 [Acidobacteriaceae bacterium]|jgi:opacity protein-like surface antigen|nr:hypothetical protein [Acidobacteriaceae bacterium]